MTSIFTFRPAHKSDLIKILGFTLDEKELFYFFPSASYPLTLGQLENQINERHDSTIMLEKKMIVGFANFYNVENRNIAFIGNVIIKPEKRRQGLGKKLMLLMINDGFKQLNLKEVHLSCYNNNTSALLFYKNLGFKPYAIETRQDFNNQPAALIHLKIKQIDWINSLL